MKKYALMYAWLVACLGTIISVYFGLSPNTEPCVLCHYQRVCLFPLSIILGVAVHDNFVGIKRYVIALPIIGAAIAVYQFILEQTSGQCALDGLSCGTQTYLFPYFTLSLASAIAFSMIIFFLIMASKYKKP